MVQMRPWSLALVGILILSSLAPGALAAPDCEEPPCGNDGGGPTADDTDSEVGDGNSTSDTAPAGDDPASSGGPAEDRHSARQQALQDRQAQREQAWSEALEDRLAQIDDDRRADILARLPDHLRDRVGLLVQTEDHYEGNFVAFTPDAQLGMLYDITADGTPLFAEIYAPVALGEAATMSVNGKTFRVSGEEWGFRLVDHPTAPMRLDATEGAPFLLVLPAAATFEPAPYGVQITYPMADGTVRHGRIVGDVVPDTADPKALQVPGEATFHLSAERALLSQVANRVRPELEDALAKRALGAEVTVLRTGTSEVFDETVLYEDLDLVIDEGTTHTTSPGPGYTITVDSVAHEGKTVVVNFERGLLDADTLAFRYYNVETDKTVEAPITQASNLVDVLDPLDDGTVAEYWVVEDADGLQVLISFPHFSMHQVELLSLVDVVVERPSLVLGTLGAIFLVSVATMGMFRRPEDEQ